MYSLKNSFLYKILFSKRPFKLTAGGWIFVLYTIGVGAGAINTGNNLLYLIFGIFLGLILASGVLSDLALWGLSAEWELPDAAEAGQPSYLLIKLTNSKKWVPSLSVSVEIQAMLGNTPVVLNAFIPCIRSSRSESRTLVFVPPRRGRFRWTGVWFYTRFPFGLLRKRWTYLKDLDDSFLVYPQIYSMDGRDGPSLEIGHESADAAHIKGEGTNIYGVREFKAGDNPRNIHWKASAKRETTSEEPTLRWLIREMELDQKEEVVLAWPTLAAVANFDLDASEKLISMTASLLASYQKSGHRVSLVIQGDGDSPFRRVQAQRRSAEESAWEFLSLIEPKTGDEEFLKRYLPPEATVEEVGSWVHVGDHETR